MSHEEMRCWMCGRGEMEIRKALAHYGIETDWTIRNPFWITKNSGILVCWVCVSAIMDIFRGTITSGMDEGDFAMLFSIDNIHGHE